MGSDHTQYFCYLDVTDTASLATIGGLFLLSVPVFIFSIRRYCKLYESHNRNVRMVYILIFIWWITYGIKDIYAAFAYFYNHQNQQTNPNNSSDMSRISVVYFALDWANTWVIQWLLLFVPYHWMKKITEIFAPAPPPSNQSERNSGMSYSEMVEVPYDGIQLKFHPFLYLYQKCRFLMIVVLAVFLAFGIQQQQAIAIKVCAHILIWCLFIDCVIIIVSLIAGMRSLRTNPTLQQLDPDESKQMYNQYLFIIIASAVRIGFDATFLISAVFTNQSLMQPSCEMSDFSTGRFILLLCTAIFTHYLPIAVVLRIYKVGDQVEDVSQSLIGESSVFKQ